MKKFLHIIYIILILGSYQHATAAEKITVGGKVFNEGYILSEIIAQLLEDNGYEVTRTFGLGGTLVCSNALKAGEIDVYPEYTGTISEAILDEPVNSDGELQTALAAMGLKTLKSFGFNNTYALTMKRDLSNRLGIHKISDLKEHLGLKLVLSHEFLNRTDGWINLKDVYQLDFEPVGIQHGLAYNAIDEGAIDITDSYSTDGDMERYALVLLEDDLDFFPEYNALPLVRNDFPEAAAKIINRVENKIDEEQMIKMNAQVVNRNMTFAEVATEFLVANALIKNDRDAPDNGLISRLLVNTTTHIKLTFIALSFGCLFGLSLAFIIYRSVRISRIVIYISGLLQTVPSIALLALMIPIMGIGQYPAIIALFLYSLLPILRSAITALTTIDPILRNVSAAIGMTKMQQLRHVLFPLALPNILAGVKTAAVICIGTATLAAFIGAGGLGEPIVTGLALNNTNLILQGAIPAACLAILVELLFELLEKMVIPEHMRTAD